MTPSQVNAQNAAQVYEKMHGSSSSNSSSATTAKLKPGDFVRLSSSRRVFDKGYLPQWTGQENCLKLSMSLKVSQLHTK